MLTNQPSTHFFYLDTQQVIKCLIRYTLADTSCTRAACDKYVNRLLHSSHHSIISLRVAIVEQRARSRASIVSIVACCFSRLRITLIVYCKPFAFLRVTTSTRSLFFVVVVSPSVLSIEKLWLWFGKKTRRRKPSVSCAESI